MEDKQFLIKKNSMGPKINHSALNKEGEQN